MSKPKYDATIAIPTWNGEEYLKQIIDAVMTQKTEHSYELLIVDSGSKDNTLTIVHENMRRHKNIRLHEIPNSEFGHGKTRNLMAHMAQGKYVVYLSHDAIPAHDHWLDEMLAPFELSDRVVGVMGKQEPRPYCIPMLKYEIRAVFGNFGPDFGTTLFYKGDFITNDGIYDAVRFYSDVNSAAPRDFLVSKISYRDVPYAEDQLYGQDVIEAGYLKAYASRGMVVHSNDLLLKDYKKRMFDEVMGLRVTGKSPALPSRGAVIKMILKGSLRDMVRISRDGQYSVKRKLYWYAVNPLFHIEKWRGVRLAMLTDMNDKRLAAKYSLEKTRKQD
ncbi:MAG TPA: glycosyltransferase family 2 protein [Candidatus Saccharimonadia bacterium]|nr:glycosyltransferase family 2 protein [Candidatus Saccharimonadia bacterium]